ncbi:MAG: glycosyltransferase [Steroidobacteraceae bacterium]
MSSTAAQSPALSVVIPLLNEEAGLPLLFEKLYAALDALPLSYEVLFVDDGSTDGSPALLHRQYAARPDVTRVLILARNVGQHMAILAAFTRARGTYVVTLDADMQNPPEEITRIVAAMEEGADYVGTVRVRRNDAWWRRKASRMLNALRKRTTRISITDQGCMMRGYHRHIVEEINEGREVSTFVPALGYALAHNPVEIDISHAERAAGESRYSLYKLIRLNFDLMTGFSVAPLQFFSMTGLITAVMSLGFVAYLALRRIFVGPEVEGVFTLFGITFFLLGVLLMGVGVVGEYVGRIYEQVRQRPRFSIATELGGDPAPARIGPQASTMDLPR